MAQIVEFLSGVLRFFPNTMIMTLLVGGVALARLSWIFIAAGALLVTIAVLLLQYVFERTVGLGTIPGVAVLEACSLLPVVRGSGTYSMVPSMWVSVTTFFCAYIVTNAATIYTQRPSNAASKEMISVQQRKGTGLISILATVILYVAILGPRLMTGCEHWLGVLLGVALGILTGWGWWQILNAGGSDVLPDIHGVMLGLKPNIVRGNPLACTVSR